MTTIRKRYYKQCYEIGHDWAFQDCDKFILKVCLRCGAETYFFPADETEQEVYE